MRLVLGLSLVLSVPCAYAGELQQLQLSGGNESTQAVFDIDDAAGSKVVVFTLPAPDRIVIDLGAVKTGDRLKRDVPPQGMVRRVRSAPRGDGLRVVLDLNAAATARSSGLQAVAGNAYRLVLDLLPLQPLPAQAAAPAQPPAAPAAASTVAAPSAADSGSSAVVPATRGATHPAPVVTIEAPVVKAAPPAAGTQPARAAPPVVRIEAPPLNAGPPPLYILR